MRFPTERMDKRRAVLALGNYQKRSLCCDRYHNGYPVVSVRKKRQDLQMDVAGGDAELFMLSSGRAFCSISADDRNADAAENLYVYLDDRNVFESR